MWQYFGASRPFRTVVAETNTDGRMEVFGLADDDSVWHNEQTGPVVDDWTGWFPFGRSDSVWPLIGRGTLFDSVLHRVGRILPGGASPGLATLAVCRHPFGQLAAYGIARDGSAWRNPQSGGLRRWQGWRPFGFVPDPSRWPQASTSTGLRDVFVGTPETALPLLLGLDVDDSAWINRSPYVTGSQVWSGWQHLSPGSSFKSLTIGTAIGGGDLIGTATGIVEVIGIALDDTVWRNDVPQHGIALGSHPWSGWQPHGAPSDRFHTVTTLGFGVSAAFDSEVFGLALDDTIWRREPGGATWQRFGTAADQLNAILPIIPNTAGVAMGVAGTAPDGTLWFADRINVPGTWGPLQPLGSDRLSLRQFVLARDGASIMHVFATDEDGNVWHLPQNAQGVWP